MNAVSFWVVVRRTFHRLILVFERAFRKIEAVVEGIFFVPTGAFIGATFRTGAGIGWDVGSTDWAFSGCGKFSLLSGSHAATFCAE